MLRAPARDWSSIHRQLLNNSTRMSNRISNSRILDSTSDVAFSLDIPVLAAPSFVNIHLD